MSEGSRKRLSAWLKRKLEERGWSGAELARRCKPPLHFSSVNRLLEGNRTARLVTVMQIEGALGEKFK